MAYTSLPTVNAGDYWTAANHNTYIKNNFDYIATTRNIMLLAQDALYTTDTNDTHQRASFTDNKIDINVTGTDVTAVSYAADYLNFNISSTKIALWNFLIPPDFASFETAQIWRPIGTTSGNFDTKILLRYGAYYTTDNQFSALISNTSTDLYEVDISGFTMPPLASNGYPAQLIFMRFSESTDDTSDGTLQLFGINLVYKFYTT
jgi:hypothetical protein